MVRFVINCVEITSSDTTESVKGCTKLVSHIKHKTSASQRSTD